MNTKTNILLAFLLLFNFQLLAQMTELSKSEKKNYKKGVKANAKGEKKDALVYFNSIQKTNPKHIDNLYQLTIILFDDFKDYQAAFNYGNTLLQELNRRRNELGLYEKELKFDNDIEIIRKEVSGIINACKPFVDTSDDVVAEAEVKQEYNRDNNQDLQIADTNIPADKSNEDTGIEASNMDQPKSADYQSELFSKIQSFLLQHFGDKQPNSVGIVLDAAFIETNAVDTMIYQLNLASKIRAEQIKLNSEILRLENLLKTTKSQNVPIQFYLVSNDIADVSSSLDKTTVIYDETLKDKFILVFFSEEHQLKRVESLVSKVATKLILADDGSQVFVGDNSDNREVLKLSPQTHQFLNSLKEFRQEAKTELVKIYEVLIDEKLETINALQTKLQKLNWNNEILPTDFIDDKIRSKNLFFTISFLQPKAESLNNVTALTEKVIYPLTAQLNRAGYESQDLDKMTVSEKNFVIRIAMDTSVLMTALSIDRTEKQQVSSQELIETEKKSYQTEIPGKPIAKESKFGQDQGLPETRNVAINDTVLQSEEVQPQVIIKTPKWKMLEDNPTSYSSYILFQSVEGWRLPTYKELEGILKNELKTVGNLSKMIGGNEKIDFISSEYSLGNRNNNIYKGFQITATNISAIELESGDEVYILLLPNID
jgi:tetratricopeptide (TPR) repeat protein